jgi:hypothetical protein
MFQNIIMKKQYGSPTYFDQYFLLHFAWQILWWVMLDEQFVGECFTLSSVYCSRNLWSENTLNTLNTVRAISTRSERFNTWNHNHNKERNQQKDQQKSAQKTNNQNWLIGSVISYVTPIQIWLTNLAHRFRDMAYVTCVL